MGTMFKQYSMWGHHCEFCLCLKPIYFADCSKLLTFQRPSLPLFHRMLQSGKERTGEQGGETGISQGAGIWERLVCDQLKWERLMDFEMQWW